MAVCDGEETKENEKVEAFECALCALAEIAAAARVHDLGDDPRGGGDDERDDVHLHVLERIHQLQ